MSIEQRVSKLEMEMKNLQRAFYDMQKSQVTTVGRVDDTSNKVTAITPYTETKTAYYGEKEKSFYDIPDGRMSVYFTNYDGNYSISRISDRLTVSFDTLTEQTDITISIQ